MSPSRTPTGFHVTPLSHAPDKKCNFGAMITGIDINDISDTDLEGLRAATHEHQLVVIKGQQDLDPVKHWELISRLDPEALQVHGHGTVEGFKKTGGMLAKRPVHGIPSAPNVRLIGKGYQGANHYGIKNFTAYGSASNDYHRYPPSAESFAAGNTQFQRWHIDAPLYDREPPRYTALRAIKCPRKGKLTINWDDGSGMSMDAQPGQTAFVSNIQTYEMLSEEEKRTADYSWVEYAPFPYQWMENCKGKTNGFGLESEGLEKDVEEMEDVDPGKIKTYPMVWLTPTKRRALQVHTICVRKVFLRNGPNAEVRVMEDLKEIRALLYKWQERVIRPEYVLLGPVAEGDLMMWDNWSVFHSAVDYPEHYGVRTIHQANLGASKGPVGPVPIPVF